MRSLRPKLVLLVFCAVIALTSPAARMRASAQSSSARIEPHHDVPQFDAASVKPAPPNTDRTLIQITPDGASIHNASLLMILETALGVDDKHLIGAPSWANDNRYDIEAKVAPEDASKLDKLKGNERNAMLIPVLAERCNLKYHHETRELPVYALVVTNGGPKLIRGEPDPPAGLKPYNGEPQGPAKEHFKVMTVPGRIEADSISMYILADQLTRLNVVGRPVIDKTGIAGNYNFTLRWTADNLPFPILHDPDGLSAATARDENTPSSLFTAIQEQLGLKLVAQKDRVDVIVIDHIDPPSPN